MLGSVYIPELIALPDKTEIAAAHCVPNVVDHELDLTLTDAVVFIGAFGPGQFAADPGRDVDDGEGGFLLQP